MIREISQKGLRIHQKEFPELTENMTNLRDGEIVVFIIHW